MLGIIHYLPKLRRLELDFKNIAGTRFEKRIDENQRKNYWEQIFKSEEVIFHKEQKGKMQPVVTEIPIRWYNYEWALLQALKKGFKDETAYAEALKIAKRDCSELDESPSKMPEKLGFTSYSKLMNFVEEELKRF